MDICEGNWLIIYKWKTGIFGFLGACEMMHSEIFVSSMDTGIFCAFYPTLINVACRKLIVIAINDPMRLPSTLKYPG